MQMSCILFLLIGCVASLGGLFVAFCDILQVTDLVDDALNVFDSDGLASACNLLVEKLCDTLLDVVSNFATTFLLYEIVAEGLRVVAQEFVCVFINLVKTSAQVNLYILFHCLFILKLRIMGLIRLIELIRLILL